MNGILWPESEQLGRVTTTNSKRRQLLEESYSSNGPLSDNHFNNRLDSKDKGELLKAALLGGTNSVEGCNLKKEYFQRDINSNLETRYADDSLKVTGNEVDSGQRMSGSNGFDRNRMTGSANGGGNKNLSRLSDESGSQGQGLSQPQVASAEGMILGHLGGSGAVALHDIGSRSIVTGSVGAGPQVTVGSVFRSPQSVSDTVRYQAAFTTTAGSSAVGPYSPLYAASSHTASVSPYSAFYTQYPYNSGVMHGSLDAQFGSYSAVLQSMGTHAAQSQVPRSPYASGSSQASVLGQYPLHMPRTTSPGGKSYVVNANLSSHDRDEAKYRRETEIDKRRYSTGVIKDEKPHHFSVPSGFPEPARVTFASSLRESPSSHARDPQDYYKVPSGREGSLKHRILRPSDSSSSVPLGTPLRSAFINTDEPFTKRMKNEHSTAERAPNRQNLPDGGLLMSEVAQGRSAQLHYPQHFMKGSIIQLGNGEIKRVEDLETDDFRHSADVSNDLKLDSSTVTQIEENEAQGTALLGFVVGEHKIQVTVEATLEHPFFVFGQGWSSCEPTWTHKRYGLDCHKLSVGDVCISLTHKDVTEHAAEISLQQKQLKLEGNSVLNKDVKSESTETVRSSPGQGHSNRSPRSPDFPQSSSSQGQGYRSESGNCSESSTAPAKGERLFVSPSPSENPSSSQTQEQKSPPSTTS